MLGGLDDDHIAVVDERVDHRLPLHFQAKEAAVAAGQFRGNLDGVELLAGGVAFGGKGRQGRAGGDAAYDLHLGNGAAGIAAFVQQLDAPGHFRPAVQVAVPVQQAQVVVHHRGGADGAGFLNIPHRRGQAVVLDKGLDELQDPPAAGRQFPICKHNSPVKLMFVLN